MKDVTIYTDGACDPNPGRGGWAALLTCGDAEKLITGSAPDTTNNRMEVQAIIEGLSALNERCSVTVVSDSQYAVNVASGTWRPQANHDLFMQLRRAERRHDVAYTWERGHNGHPQNERAHRAAYRAIPATATIA